jgi:GTP pyrophosphokinase
MPERRSLHEALGLGESRAAQVAGAIQRRTCMRANRAAGRRAARARRRANPSRVQGIGDLLSTYARCCARAAGADRRATSPSGAASASSQPSPARTCALSARKAPARVLAVAGASTGKGEFPVDIDVQAFDRRGLLRDVSAVLADEKISIGGIAVTRTTTGVAHMQIGISIDGPAAAIARARAHRAGAQRHRGAPQEIER